MLVIDAKVIGYEYFMDDLEPYEAHLLNETLPWAIHQSMEQTRLLGYIFASPYMKHRKDITAWMPLYTDENEPVERLEGTELEEARRRIQAAFKI